MSAKQCAPLIRMLAVAAILVMRGGPSFGQAVSDSSSAAAIDATHFLWYSGHWSKTKKNTFIIAKNGTGIGTGAGPITGGGGAAGSGTGGSGTGAGGTSDPGGSGGGTITIGSDGSVQMSGAAIDAWNKKMAEAEQIADQYLQQLNNPVDNLEPATHRLHEMLKPEAEEQKQEVADLKIKPKQDLLLDADDPVKPLTRDQMPDYCRQIKSQYDEVMNYYNNRVKGHQNDLNVPIPPRFEYDCFSCDSNIQKTYDTTIAHYVRDFMHPEDSIIHKGSMILHQLAISGISKDYGISEDYYEAFFQKDKKDASKSGACSYLELSALSQAVYETARHLYLRADKLVMDNRKNFRSIEAVNRTYLPIARQWELMTGGQSGYEYIFQEMQSTMARALDYYLDELRHDDWRQIGNLPWMFGLFRDQAMLGGVDNWSSSMEYLTKMQQMWNGFRLTIEMDIKTGAENAYRLAHVKGDCHIIPEFQRDSNQCYKWVVADEDLQDILGFYRKKNLQSIDCKVIANEMVSPPQVPKITYTGTRKYTVLLKGLSMDFCNPGHDTILLTGFTPNPAAAGTWVIPYAGTQNMGLNGLEQYFESLEEKKKIAESGEVEKQADEMKQRALQLKAQMDAMKQSASFQNAGTANGQISYEKIQELREKIEGLSTNTALAKMLYIDFLLPVKNNEPVLVDKTFDAKEINPQEAPAILYGRYTIHIENDANGKTKKPPSPPLIHVDNTILKK